MLVRFPIMTAVIAMMATGLYADDDAKVKLGPEEMVKIVKSVEPSLVMVELSLRFDKGDAPSGGGWRELCPNCGTYHGGSDGEKYVKEERPAVVEGYLIDGRTVITKDNQIHPRFIDKIQVRGGGEAVDINSISWGKTCPMLTLHLAEPLPNAKPLVFDTSLEGPYFTVMGQMANGEWTVSVNGLSRVVSHTRDGRTFMAARPAAGVVVNREGKPVTILMREELPAGDDWCRAPDAWEMIDADETKKCMDSFGATVKQNLLHAHLTFRSPKKDQTESMYDFRGDDETVATDLHSIAVLLPNDLVMVPVGLKKSATARLKRIRLNLPNGETSDAEFVGSLEDYGAIIARLTSSVADNSGVRLVDSPLRGLRNDLLLEAHVTMRGEQRVEYLNRTRLTGFERRWKNQLFPSFSSEKENHYIFDADGRLVALGMERRKLVGDDNYWSDETVFMPADLLATIIGDLDNHIDPNNIPLTEEEENRIAWLGVELQPLDAELARANEVSDMTNDGSTGGMVAYVYEGSPAAKQGLELGDILTRLFFEGQSKPVDIDASVGGYYGFRSEFPWEQLDELPEQYFDRIPKPWPSVENSVNKVLTQSGFGKKFSVELIRDGEQMRKDFIVEQSPAHYDSAAKFKHEGLGITVRNMTYELRRYYQRPKGEPGVVVSKIESGSKASVAGMKPYELVTAVNDQPVADVEEFEAQLKGISEVRLSIRRMTRERVVMVTLPEKANSESAEEAEDAAEE